MLHKSFWLIYIPLKYPIEFHRSVNNIFATTASVIPLIKYLIRSMSQR